MAHELTLTRLLDAPAEALFRCWTTPELMKQWFKGPGWDLAVCEFDGRVGGKAGRTMKQRCYGVKRTAVWRNLVWSFLLSGSAKKQHSSFKVDSH